MALSDRVRKADSPSPGRRRDSAGSPLLLAGEISLVLLSKGDKIRAHLSISPIHRLLLFCLVLTGWIENTRAYNLEGFAWPYGTKVVMQLGLGPTNIALQDGFGSWNASAADAVDIWNGYLDFISISSVSLGTVPQVSGDGLNSVFFSNTIFGDSFDEFTLAVTVLLTTDDSTVTAEGDVVMNVAARLDSYRGAQQSDARGDIYDFHRIAVHEFGHVIGLDHQENDPPGVSLMEPIISDLDHLGADDVFGIRELYGAEIFNLNGEILTRVGDQFYSFELAANNSPTSYSAVGLPPGVTINPATGMMTGTVTTPGEYNPVVTAHGPFADAYGSRKVTVSPLDAIPGLLSIIRTNGTALLADPVRPRLYATADDGLNMINTETYEVTQLVAGNQLPDALSLSADNSALYYHPDATSVVHRIDLESLQSLPDLQVPTSYSHFLEGLDGRAYLAGVSTQVYQLNAATGEVQATIDVGSSSVITMTPDRRILLIAKPGVSLSCYDISTPVPTLLATSNGSYSNLTPSLDSRSVYGVFDFPGEIAQTVRLPLPVLTPSESLASDVWLGFISVAPDGSIYQCRSTLPGTISVYDPVSLERTGMIDLSYPRVFAGFLPFSVVFDHDGPYFYAVIGGSSEIWKFSTDFASYPPAEPAPTMNVLNVSTRARVGTGEEAMIGGFIVQEGEPKKVLVRGIGPSLPLTGALSDPVIDLYDGTGKLIATNDDWVSDRFDILAAHLPPTSAREAAIVMTLNPGAYTAVVHDVTGQPGQALVEAYDLAPDDSRLVNISTRGKVGTDDEVMIGGFVIGGVEATEVLVRAIGPSLAAYAISQPLADPVLELYDYRGALVATNDDWRSTQEAEIVASGLAPSDDRESTIFATLAPGNYTAIVRGQARTVGVALVEAYDLGQSHESGK